MEKKIYIDILTAEADRNKRPYEMALADFLDFCLELFSIKAFKGGMQDYATYMFKVSQKSQKYTELALQWFSDVADAMDRGEWLDAFGTLYEEMYLSRGKASNKGQFFTPQSVSDLMAQLTSSKEQTSGTVNDCAAGSGRLLLSHYIEKSKLNHSAGRRFEYIAQDSDPIACKMCALNLMAHGMAGKVICQDTLLMSTPQFVIHINEVKYPFNTPYYSVRIESPQAAETTEQEAE